MTTTEKTFPITQTLSERYAEIRQSTISLCAPLEIEDYAVQPSAEVSPPKWHLGHTTWFFEEMVLVKYLPDYTRVNDQFSKLFNSYYNTASGHWIQSERGQLSRPTVREVLAYRQCVDAELMKFLTQSNPDSEIAFLIETGLNHEQQHQELLLMDIKYILGTNPIQAVYSATTLEKTPRTPNSWESFTEGIYKTGFKGDGFAYDNERPNHKVYLQAFKVRKNLVTNGEYLKFIEDSGYQNPLFWLSKGWDWVKENAITAPLYWQNKGNDWVEFTLHGPQPLDLNAPLAHISYFEADAYANWAGCRLPTEQESELFLREFAQEKRPETRPIYHPTQADSIDNQVWWWTQSHYSPYPGFKKFDGEIGEYNGKFMCNQFVLKGGCVATPKGHHRNTYRNFYQPHQRWMFSGLRLGQDL